MTIFIHKCDGTVLKILPGFSLLNEINKSCKIKAVRRTDNYVK